jgi:membrane protease YdiL (CAAX protease family)
VLAGVVGFLAVWPICFLSAWLGAMLLPPREHQVIEHLMRFAEDGRTGGILLLVGAAVPVAAISEEVFFRGLMQSSLRDVFARLAASSTDADKPDPASAWAPPGATAARLGLSVRRNLGAGPRWAAVLVTSLLFAGAHVPYWHAMPALFALSVCMGLLLERTGSLAAPVVVHLLFNALNVAVSFGRE